MAEWVYKICLKTCTICIHLTFFFSFTFLFFLVSYYHVPLVPDFRHLLNTNTCAVQCILASNIRKFVKYISTFARRCVSISVAQLCAKEQCFVFLTIQNIYVVQCPIRSAQFRDRSNVFICLTFCNCNLIYYIREINLSFVQSSVTAEYLRRSVLPSTILEFSQE